MQESVGSVGLPIARRDSADKFLAHERDAAREPGDWTRAWFGNSVRGRGMYFCCAGVAQKCELD